MIQYNKDGSDPDFYFLLLPPATVNPPDISLDALIALKTPRHPFTTSIMARVFLVAAVSLLQLASAFDEIGFAQVGSRQLADTSRQHQSGRRALERRGGRGEEDSY